VTSTEIDSIAVDLALSAGGAADRFLENADRVFVREASDYKRGRNVNVLGEVPRPGPYAIREGEDRLASVLARAGGLSSIAASDRIQIFRPGEGVGQQDVEFDRLSRLSRSEMTDAEYQTFKTKLAARQATYIVDYAVLVGSPSSAFDVPLKDRDVILVDRTTQAIRIAGEVQRPSLIEFQAGREGKDYIALAGGFTRRAQRGKVRLTRAGSNQTIYLGEAREVQPGDFIWVPEKRDANFWGVVKDVILVAGSAATVVILVRNNSR
jgi:protein involved in polysaccharide export with SLBB domain